MAPKVKTFQGIKTTSPVTDRINHPLRALPASWFTSENMYQLERRAIFSSEWMLITHKVRFRTLGDWVKFECAGYEFIISRDRKDRFRAFHNIFRHQAYPVVEGESRRASIFACKYHGWSHGLDGKLVKAPRYEELEGFDRNQNGMLRIHLRMDANGFIWVNLNSSEELENWEQDFANIDKQERFDNYNFEEYVFDHEFQMDANVNWKLCVDNFNECYHCPTSHPTIPTLFDIETLTAESNHGWTIYTTAQTEEQKRDGLQIYTTYYYPYVSTNILPHYIMLQRFLPHSARKSTMHYQIFRNQNSPQELFDLVNNLYKQVMSEDKALAVGVHKNMVRGIFVNGQMHPRLESAPLHLQAKTRETVKAHIEKEKAAGHQIWPAHPILVQDSKSREDEALHAGLAYEPAPKDLLD